jgi:hypothetical protein
VKDSSRKQQKMNHFHVIAVVVIVGHHPYHIHVIVVVAGMGLNVRYCGD